MKRFEYQMTKHRDEEFAKLVYFCNDVGECSLDQVPVNQTQMFSDLLNGRGSEGWELVQTLFGKGGVVLIWKREI